MNVLHGYPSSDGHNLYTYPPPPQQQQQPIWAPHAPLLSSRHYLPTNYYQPQPFLPAPPPPPAYYGFGPVGAYPSVPQFAHGHGDQLPPYHLPQHLISQQQSQPQPQQDRNGDIWGPPVVGVDHPSFNRPPHRASPSSSRERSRSSSHESQKPIYQHSSLPLNPDPNFVYDLIPSNVSAVPPPPAIEKSGVPLSDLATEMVWEACQLAIEGEDGRPSEGRKWERMTMGVKVDAKKRVVQEPRTPETNSNVYYGAIGEKRTNVGSGWSSPSSSAPGTPLDLTPGGAGGRKKLSGLGLGWAEEEEFVRRRLSDSPMDDYTPSSQHSRSTSSHSTTSSTSEPTPAFRQFVKQVLTATLIAPEDLVLALYYVARIPSSSIIQPPPADQRLSISARANAIKAAPFKVFLGALMLANKTLQDNSYRNETFATVSGIPLKDVNELEIFVYGGLGFDVSVKEDVWGTWLGVMGERGRCKKGDVGERYEVEMALMALRKASGRQQSANVGVTVQGLATPPTTPERKRVINTDNSTPLGANYNYNCATGWSPTEMRGRPTNYYWGPPTTMGMGYPVSQTREGGTIPAF